MATACSIGRVYIDLRPSLEDSVCLRDSKERLRLRSASGRSGDPEIE